MIFRREGLLGQREMPLDRLFLGRARARAQPLTDEGEALPEPEPLAEIDQRP